MQARKTVLGKLLGTISIVAAVGLAVAVVAFLHGSKTQNIHYATEMLSAGYWAWGAGEPKSPPLLTYAGNSGQFVSAEGHSLGSHCTTYAETFSFGPVRVTKIKDVYNP